MRFNTTALVLAPGIGLVGILAAGWLGLGWALFAWGAGVALGTAVYVAHALIDKAAPGSLAKFPDTRPFQSVGAPDTDSQRLRHTSVD